jgi:hypothetical protein
MKQKIKVLNLEKLYNEINNPDFISGLEKSLEIAQRGFECGFRVLKRPFEDLIYHTGSIEVGTPTDFGGKVGLEYADELYRKSTGKNPETVENQDEFADFFNQNGLVLDSYPVFDRELIQREDYPLFIVRARPKGKISPLIYDVLVLNNVRANANARPITLMVSKDETKEDCPVFFFQDKTKQFQRIKSIQDLIERTNALSFLAMSRGKPIDMNAWNLFGYPNFYNIGFGNFNTETKSIGVNFDLNDFSYEEGVEN